MTDAILIKLFEHHHWANQQMLQACAALSDAQLDAEPQSATKGNIRLTWLHLAVAQQRYLAMLTVPFAARREDPLAFAGVAELLRRSDEGLLALVRAEPDQPADSLVQTRDGSSVARWVVLVQAINHATEHREQINSMLTALGVKAPDLDGWTYAVATGAYHPLTP